MKLAYDAQGQRFRKQIGSNLAVYFAYDLQGQLLGEYTLSGSTFKPLMEYIWLEGQPVAAVRPTPGAPANAPNSAQEVFYLHTDHLGTPRVALDTAGRVRWRWMGGEPFGLSPAENNPTAGLSELNISLRLPGQQYDGFVGLHYNYFRDYDPTVGRYVQSDPIGLAGGINTYAYVGGNPITGFDPEGLANGSAAQMWMKSKTPPPQEGIIIHGNWCGPTWTGGRRHTYSPASDGYYKFATDATDAACRRHDVGYYLCRQAFPCDSERRGKCMTERDRMLAHEVKFNNSLVSMAIFAWMNNNNLPDAGPNAPSCACESQ